MTKLNLPDIGSLANSASARQAINDNFAAIEAAIDNTLSRDGTTPNQMEADIDLNDHKLLNVADPVDEADGVNLRSIRPIVTDYISEIAETIIEGTARVEVFTATAGQTDFPLQESPGTVNNLMLVDSGIVMTPGVDYTLTDSDLKTATFFVGRDVGNEIVARYTMLAPTDSILRGDLNNPVSGLGGDLVVYNPPSTGVLGSVKGFLDSLWTAGATSGAALIRFLQSGAGAVARSAQDKLREWPSVADYGALGDGVTSDQTAFDYALAEIAGPIYVPYTVNHYVLTALTDTNRERLWGPGRVKVVGIDVALSSEPRMYPNDTPSHSTLKAAWQPSQYPGVQGSIGNGAANDDLTRTGGFGTYGSHLKRLHVTAPTPAGQFDVVDTSWATNTNLTGGQLFGGWHGANTPAGYLGQTYSGGAAVGHEVNVGNRWADFGLQTDVGGTRYTVGQQIVPDVLPAKDGENTTTVTGITTASPAVITVTSHGYSIGMGVVFSGAGTLPTGLSKDTTYYIVGSGFTANSFQVATVPGGSSVNTTAGTFAAPITIRPSYPGSFGTVWGASIWGHRWWVGTLLRANTIMPGGYGHYASGGSVAGQAPAAWLKTAGYWARGLDMRSNVFSSYVLDMDGSTYTAAMNLDFASSVITTATAGGFTLPSNPAGFIKIAINGNIKHIPYYNP